MATIATLDTVLRARTQKFDAQMTKSRGIAAGFKSAIAKLSLAGIALGAAFAVSVRRFVKTGDAIAKMAKRTGVAADELQALTFAAEQSGASAESVEKAIRGLNRNIIDMQRGLSTARDNFSDLGLTIEDLGGLNVQERFELIASRLNQIEDASIQSGVAMKIFGRSGSEIIPLLKDVDSLTDEFERMGLALSADELRAAEQLADQFNIMKREADKLTATFVTTFSPAIIQITRDLTGLFDQMQAIIELDFEKAIKVSGPGAGSTIAGVVPNLGTGLGAVAKLIKPVQEQVKIQRDIKRQIEQSVPALEKGSFETIRFLRRQNDDRKQNNEKQVGLLEKINENLVSIEGSIAGNQAGFGQVGFQIDPLGALR